MFKIENHVKDVCYLSMKLCEVDDTYDVGFALTIFLDAIRDKGDMTGEEKEVRDAVEYVFSDKDWISLHEEYMELRPTEQVEEIKKFHRIMRERNKGK